MPSRKFKLFIVLFFLLEAIFLIFQPFLEKKEFFIPNSLTNHKYERQKQNVSTVFYVKSHGGNLQNHKTSFQSVFKEASVILNSGLKYLKSDYYRFDLMKERSARLMLFPYHSYW